MDKTRITKSSIKKNNDRGRYIRASPLFQDVMQKQRKNLSAVTEESVKGTDFEITELLAKKIIKNRLV